MWLKVSGHSYIRPCREELAAGVAVGTSTELRWIGSNTAQVGMSEHGQRCPPQLHADLPGARAQVTGGGSLGLCPPWLLSGLSQMPAAQMSIATTGAPDQSHCCSRKEQLGLNPRRGPAGQGSSGVSQTLGLPGSPPIHTAASFLQRLSVGCVQGEVWTRLCIFEDTGGGFCPCARMPTWNKGFLCIYYT